MRLLCTPLVKMLCSTCLGMLENKQRKVETVDDYLQQEYLHHENAKQLFLAAESGCMICFSLWDEFSDDEKDRLLWSEANRNNALDKSGEYTAFSECWTGGSAWLSSQQTLGHDHVTRWSTIEAHPEYPAPPGCFMFEVRGGPKHAPITMVHQFGLQPVENENSLDYKRLASYVQNKATGSFCLCDTVVHSQVTWTTRNGDALNLAKEWTTMCLDSHATCCKAEDDQWYPTRLRDLTSGQGSFVSASLTALCQSFADVT